MSNKPTKPVRRNSRVATPAKAESKRPRPSRNGADEILPEYDFTGARRNPYAARFAAGSNVVVLDPDVASVFPTAASVNEALRALAGVIRQHGGRSGSRRRTT
jgi:hypothetical protein